MEFVAAMHIFIKLFLTSMNICRFKSGPEALSRSPEFLRCALYLYIGVNSVLIMLSMTWVNGLLQVFVQLGLLVGFTWGVLFIFGNVQRFSQTLTALLGVDSIISFCSLPVVGLLKSDMLPEKGFLLFLVIMLWHWGVMGHIFRHALSRSLASGLGLSFLFFYGSYYVIFLLPRTII
jgi:hypothetical protein